MSSFHCHYLIVRDINMRIHIIFCYFVAFALSMRKQTILQKRHTSNTVVFNFASTVVDAVLRSPLRGSIVQVARNTMIKSLRDVGLDWAEYYRRIESSRDWKYVVNAILEETPNLVVPDYYRAPFHAYDAGNLCLQSALEQELAGKAMGVRNYPSYGAEAENHLRGLYDQQIKALGGLNLPKASGRVQIVDLGCGTGTSTRRLARLCPSADTVSGFDLSPHMIAVGRFLQHAIPRKEIDWVENISEDPRITLQCADIAQLPLPTTSVSLVNLCFVLHEVPFSAAKAILREAARVLVPGGVLCIMEMDPSAPAYQRARNNPLLFSVFQSTEPYLLDYFDQTAPQLISLLESEGFSTGTVVAATGRHLAVVARKSGFNDERETGAHCRWTSTWPLRLPRHPVGEEDLG